MRYARTAICCADISGYDDGCVLPDLSSCSIGRRHTDELKLNERQIVVRLHGSVDEHVLVLVQSTVLKMG